MKVSMTSVKLQGQGASDWLLENANKAQAPFWVYTGSAGNYTSGKQQRFTKYISNVFFKYE